MMATDIIFKYFTEEKEASALYFPAVGLMQIKKAPTRIGRNIQTGDTIEVPGRYSLDFKQLLTFTQPCDKEKNRSLGKEKNDHFFTWLEGHVGEYPNEDLQELVLSFFERVRDQLDATPQVIIQSIGTLNVVKNPAYKGRDPKTREVIEFPEKLALRFTPDGTIVKILNPPKTNFLDLPSNPVAIPKEGLSTFTLQNIPSAKELWKLCQSLGALALCDGDDETFRVEPSLESGIHHVRFSDGGGNDCDIYFVGGDVFMRGFARTASMSNYGWEYYGDPLPDGSSWQYRAPWPGTLEGLPSHLHQKLFDNHIRGHDLSFAIWFLEEDEQWHKGKITRFPDNPADKDPDGSNFIFNCLPLDPVQWVEINADKEFGLEAVKKIYEHTPLTEELVAQLSPDCEFNADAISKTGYPIAG
jgi:nucleoid DNA-binding protein